MKYQLSILLLIVLLLTGCVKGDGSGNGNNNTTTTKTTVRSYAVDCGNAENIGHGSCGLTVTSISVLGGGGQ